MILNLKIYQERSLEVLRQYLAISRLKGAKQAYEEIQNERYGNNPFKPFQAIKGLEETPYVCLRLPTGGGKTILSAYTIRLAGETYIENEFPLTLWLVPTNTIKSQTLETLKNPEHPNYKVLENASNGRFRVFDIADFRQIRPQDISDSVCIIISTFASLRVDNTEGRKVYDHDENLEPHFSRIPANTQGMEKNEASGQIKFSLANLLHWYRPLVIIDEAHNAKSELSIEVLNRVNAACVIEYTATPADNSNIIVSVSAAELKAEQMIKLPILFFEHNSWEEAITASIQRRQQLEELANKDVDYIRPIVLFQAENKGQEVTVEVLEKYLVDNENIKRDQIAIATGEQHELDSINLFDPNCPIRYVITVQALKEGWDCSFAYVFCSVANTKSKTAIEQLLGRVLRMPYAKNRSQEYLNKAYAHVSAKSWPDAVTTLHDRLVNMGFEKQEAEEFIVNQPSLNIEEPIVEYNKNAPFEPVITTKPDLSQLTLEEQAHITVKELSEERFSLSVQCPLTPTLVEKLARTVTNKQDKNEIMLAGEIYLQKNNSSTPAERGENFSIPQLCLNFEEGIELAERELCLNENGWNLLDYYRPLTKEDFEVNEEIKQYIVDLTGQKIDIQMAENIKQLELQGIYTDMSELDLVYWLDRKLQQPDIKQEILSEFLRRTVRDLLNRSDLDMAQLVRGKFIIEKMLRERISLFRKKAYQKGYQKCMFSDEAIVTVEPNNFNFTFDPNNYPANSLYEGPIKFNKHYYSRVGSMNGEEVECAKAIDSHSAVKFWVRNLEREPYFSFWLPTSSDKFYPDFIAQLNDERLLVVEYKGAHLDKEDAKEKELIGKLWAKKTGNLFLMAWEKDDNGRDVFQQVNKILSTE
jgi:type III restriction enzyme